MQTPTNHVKPPTSAKGVSTFRRKDSDFAATEHIIQGARDIIHAFAHPVTTLLRVSGQVVGASLIFGVIGVTVYAIHGKPNTARIDPSNPGSYLQVGYDKVGRPITRVLSDVAESINSDIQDSVKEDERD